MSFVSQRSLDGGGRFPKAGGVKWTVRGGTGSEAGRGGERGKEPLGRTMPKGKRCDQRLLGCPQELMGSFQKMSNATKEERREGRRGKGRIAPWKPQGGARIQTSGLRAEAIPSTEPFSESKQMHPSDLCSRSNPL